MSDEKVSANLILEIIGRPPEHLVETLGRIIDEMGKEKGVRVNSKNIREPIPIKESKEFYTTFAEIGVETEDAMRLSLLMFKYMPAYIEVISPERILLKNTDFGDILTELTRRLHTYDEIARMMQIENQNLVKKIKEIESGKREEFEGNKEVKEENEK
ncbi:MAG: hypothetical protein QXU40_01720 [Candidatus Pacearchaeota archaeon]